MPRFLTYQQVADQLQTPVGTVRYWVQVGELRAYKPGRRPLVREDDEAEERSPVRRRAVR